VRSIVSITTTTRWSVQSNVVIPRHPVVTLTGNTTTAALTPDPTTLALTLHDWRTQLTTTTPGAALTPQPTEAQLT
jgi:hypothetical protein